MACPHVNGTHFKRKNTTSAKFHVLLGFRFRYYTNWDQTSRLYPFATSHIDTNDVYACPNAMMCIYIYTYIYIYINIITTFIFDTHLFKLSQFVRHKRFHTCWITIRWICGNRRFAWWPDQGPCLSSIVVIVMAFVIVKEAYRWLHRTSRALSLLFFILLSHVHRDDGRRNMVHRGGVGRSWWLLSNLEYIYIYIFIYILPSTWRFKNEPLRIYTLRQHLAPDT
jgi:hypothetical protein